jgi:diguanylate cyclase (GGDEF)-like protein/PAS domain S-box-containing protein
LVAIEGVARDITIRKQAEELLRMQYNLTLAVSAASTRVEALQHLLEHVLHIDELDCGGVYLQDKRSGSLHLVAHQGLSAEFTELASQYAADTPQAQLVMAGKPLYRSFAEFADSCGAECYDESLRAVAVIPVRSKERIVAVLNLASRHCDEIPENTRAMLEAIAAQISGILARLEAQEALSESEERFRQVAEHIGAVVWLTDPDRNELLYVSPTCETVYGLSPEELYTNPRAFIEAVHPDDRAWVKAQIENQWAGIMEIEHRLLLAEGMVRWVWVHTRPILDDHGNVVRRVGIVKDITERKTYQQQIEHLAFSDRLTGLPNRNRLYQVGNATLAAMVPNGEGLVLLYLDIDRFKAVNDTLGHDMGDELLILVAERLRNCVPAGNLLARLGGDEFALLLPATNSAQALEVARQILEHLRQPFMLGEQLVHLWGSIGIAIGTSKDISFSMLLTQADIAMYRAKARGGGVQIYDPALHPVRVDRLQMEADLRHALKADGLTLHYQPVLNLCTETVTWFEALVRWQHPARGLLSPGMFLPLAEETGLIEEVDRWVLQTVIRQIAAWGAAGMPLTVSINLTAQSLQKPHLVDDVAAMLESAGVSPEQIIIELTEHTALRDLATTRQVLAELRQLGVRIALDDFGRGYASLTHLRQLPVDVLKLDAAFAAGIGKEMRDEAVIRALLTLAQGLGLIVVVEGIEEIAQLDWLRQGGCFLGQGYYIGRPVEPGSIRYPHKIRYMHQDDHVSSSA